MRTSITAKAKSIVPIAAKRLGDLLLGILCLMFAALSATGATLAEGSELVRRGESTPEAAGLEAISSCPLASGGTLRVAFFPDAVYTLTLGSEMPGFGGSRTFSAHIGDGVFTSLVIVKADGGVFVEVRDIAGARLYRASLRDGVVEAEEIDLTAVRRGGCIEVEADDDAIESTEAAADDDSGSGATKKGRTVRAVAGNPFDDNVVAPNGAPVMVDIMLVFDNGAQAWVANQTKYDGSITNFAIAQVAKMNSVLANTGLHTNFWYRLVDVMTVDTTYTVVDNQILGIIKSGAESGDGSYGPIKAHREACGADLVSLMIDTGSAWGTTGIGYITHGTTYNTWLGQRAWCYSCCAIRSVDLEYTLSHEVGHNMGLAHSPTLASWTKPGTFDYSNGYNFWGKDDNKPYHTIMAYDQDVNYTGYIEIPYFSSPDYTYQGTVIGTVLSNDCTRALRETCSAFANWRDATIPLPSDITFSPSGSEAYRITLSTLGGYEIRYTTDGSAPTRSSTLYTGPLTLKSGSVTIKAVAVVDENTLGAVAEKTFTASVELNEYVILKELYGYGWNSEYWDDQDGNEKYAYYWNSSSDKTAVVDASGVLTVNRNIDLGTLVANGTNSLEIVATDNALFATNLHVMGNTTLTGDKFSFENWNLHPESTLTLSPGEGNTVTLNKYLAQGATGSTLAITNGTFSVTKGANSGDGIATLQNCALRIDNGGILSLEPGWVLGYSNPNPVTVNKGGLLKINKLESTHRPLVLNGGNVDVNLTGRAYELRTVDVTATDDSTIADKTANGGARIYLIEGDSTFTVSEGKTLTVDISTEKEKGIIKKGQGEARFQRELFHTGTNTINAGTFTIAYNSSTTNCANWIVSSGATLKIEDGKSLAIPKLELASGAILDLPASSAAAPLVVSNSVALANVAFRLTGAADFELGKSYPLIAAQDGLSGIVKIDKSLMPPLASGLAWKFAKNADGVLCATVVDAADAKDPITIVGVDDSLALEIPDDATTVYGAVTVGGNPLVVDSIGDTAVAFTLDVELPESSSATEQTICSWIVEDDNVMRCVRRADGVLDVFYGESSHADNITNSVALASGRHTIKIGYNYGDYGGTWAFVDDKPAYWAKNLKWHEKAVIRLAIGATADATPQYPFAGLVLRGLGILKANSSLPLPNMTGTSGITYNYLIQNNAPTNSIPSVFPNAVSGGFSMDNSLLDAVLPESGDSITVSIVASFPADKPGCLFGIWAKSETDGYSYPGQIDYNGDGSFSFSRNGYVNTVYYSRANSPDASVESPHLYTLEYRKGEGFGFYQDGVQILTASYGYVDNPCYVFHKVVFGRGPWNKMTTTYDDNENPISGFTVYASHIELGSDDRSVSEAAVMESLNFDSAYDAMTIAGKLAYLPANQTADGVAAPAEVPEEDLDPAPPATPATIDILVGYDNGAQTYVANKSMTLEVFAQEQIKKMNDVLVTNKLDRFYSYRLAGVCKVDATYTTVESVSQNLVSGSGPLVTLRAARELYGADTVTLLVNSSGGATLGDSIPLSHSTDVASRHECAFSVCSISAVDTGTQHTMIHENAHNMGCGHARQQSAVNSPFEYGRGFYFIDGTTKRHTIMAYDVDGTGVYAHPSPYFSTTSKEFGFALGDKTNNNARVLKETCGEVAKWRTSVVPDADGIRAFDENGSEILSDCFFNDSLKVTVVAPVEGAELYYTFDGSEPVVDDDAWHQTSPFTFNFTTNRNLKIAYLDGETLSPVRNIRFTKTANVSSNGLWQTCLKYPWMVEGDTIRSFNQTDYTYQCTTPLRATIVGPKRLSFKHKSYFGGVTQGGDNYSHFHVLLDDSPVLAQTECTNSWSEAYVDIPGGTHDVVFVFSQRFAMNNSADNKDVTPEANDAVWLKDIRLEENADAVLDIPLGSTVNLSEVPSTVTTITGFGTLYCGATLPGKAYGLTDSEAWKGTVAFKGLAENDDTKNFKFELYGNENSKIQLTNCAINWLNASNTNTTDTVFAGELVLVGDAAFSTKDGYSDNYNVFGELSGSGSMLLKNKPMQGYVFNTATNFAGSITVQADENTELHAMQGRRIVFGEVAEKADLPTKEAGAATITVLSGAAAAIGTDAKWNAYNGIEIAGTIAVKGAGATLSCNDSASLGLLLDGGATIRFDAQNATLTFAKTPVFTNGTVTVAFGDGVAPTNKMMLLTWPEGTAITGTFAIASAWSASYALMTNATGLVVAPTEANRYDIPGTSAYLAYNSTLEAWLEESNDYNWNYDGEWKTFLDATADNGHTYFQNFILGYEAENEQRKFKISNISFDSKGKVLIETNEGNIPAGFGIVKRLYRKSKLTDPWPEEGEIMEGKSAEIQQEGAGFFKVKIFVEP